MVWRLSLPSGKPAKHKENIKWIDKEGKDDYQLWSQEKLQQWQL